MLMVDNNAGEKQMSHDRELVALVNTELCKIIF